MTIREEVPLHATRARLLRAIDALPDEAYDWLVFATARRTRVHGHTPIWPDGLVGFTATSRRALLEVRAAADAYLAGDTALIPLSS